MYDRTFMTEVFDYFQVYFSFLYGQQSCFHVVSCYITTYDRDMTDLFFVNLSGNVCRELLNHLCTDGILDKRPLTCSEHIISIWLPNTRSGPVTTRTINLRSR